MNIKLITTICCALLMGAHELRAQQPMKLSMEQCRDMALTASEELK